MILYGYIKHMDIMIACIVLELCSSVCLVIIVFNGFLLYNIIVSRISIHQQWLLKDIVMNIGILMNIDNLFRLCFCKESRYRLDTYQFSFLS